ncbi:MAG: endonuclease III [Melioribacteraceae bacterium]|nr:endonuclease III [Melioribacteraceae bacterium]MCF8265492.1 endonuclease III [Melioribacteraceae bacterium]MCF8413177.1 endonuclease III [Melioribacteraceae bacterium]MCF8431933.1 endonuclease III [Melioribacteraceae bacterium]
MKDRNALIKKINKKLIERFGIPYRAEIPPDPLDMILATILSQNTNDKNSYKAFQNLKTEYETWEKVRTANVASIENAIRVAGLGKQKSNAIKNLLSELFEKRGALSLDFIRDEKSDDALVYLSSFKGIGIKTASCVLLFALEKDVCPVDTHVHRIVNRIGIVSEKDRDKTYFSLNKKFPKGVAHPFHTNLIRLGRQICKPKNPACKVCPIEKLCNYEVKNFEDVNIPERNDFMLLDHVN